MYTTINVKSYESSTREHRGGSMEKEALPCLLGGGGGWPGNVCYPCKAGSSFGLLDVLWAPVDAPLWAQTQSRDHAVTSRVHNQEGMQDVCSAQRPVNTYATHVYLHKCRVTGLLQRGKGESAETWWHSKNFLRDAVCQSVCAGGLEITCGFQMWKRTSICILKWESVFVFLIWCLTWAT